MGSFVELRGSILKHVRMALMSSFSYDREQFFLLGFCKLDEVLTRHLFWASRTLVCVNDHHEDVKHRHTALTHIFSLDYEFVLLGLP